MIHDYDWQIRIRILETKLTLKLLFIVTVRSLKNESRLKEQ
jgi:hypothetical protein